MVYDINGSPLLSESPNCKIIAHRGYHVTAKQNTIDALVAAAAAGFSWIEIDIRKCADGIYVLSHDASVTLYNNGMSTSVNITTSNYETIKGYTWDSAGTYKLCTLQAAFNAMMIYNMDIICDIKNGTNSDIVSIASMCGTTDKILLSYGSFQSAYNDRDLLLNHDNIRIRCVPSNYSHYETLAGAISNPIFADINSSDSIHYQQYLNIALSCGIPIIFSGCTTSNGNIWSVLANGAMANLDTNITWNQFYSMLDIDYNNVTTITASSSATTVSVNGTATITASSDLSTGGGYVYGFILDPSKATVKQTAFGQNSSFTVTGISSGTTKLRLFDGSGEMVDVTITIS